MNKSEEEQKQRVLDLAKEKDVKIINLQFTDLLGTTKSLQLPITHLEEALDGGIGFDGSSIEGFVRIFESDMVAFPDPATFKILPGRPADKAEARLICYINRPGGEPFEGDPRWILRRMLDRAASLGLTYNVGPELEFFLLKTDDVKPVPHDVGGYFDFSPRDAASDVRRDAIFALDQLGLNVEMGHHEVAPGQHELDFRFGEALTTADNTITYKYTLKAIAHQYGLVATFMPKPYFGMNGSGMHTHQSMVDIKTGKNAFFDKNDKYNLSKMAYHFIGGQLKFAREICGIIAPTVNSYKRLVPGYEAPVYVCWARRNRSSLIRVPEYFPGEEMATRAELRCPDPSCNPYLAFAAMLGAGLEGIEKKIEPPDPVEEDVYEFDDTELAKFYITTLPGSLGEAIEEIEKSSLIEKTLGSFSYRRFLDAKKAEWDEYRLRVSDWEVEKYLYTA